MPEQAAVLILLQALLPRLSTYYVLTKVGGKDRWSETLVPIDVDTELADRLSV